MKNGDTLAVDAVELGKMYNQGRIDRQVLLGFNFQLRAGECIALLGPNGSGKTTVLHLIAGLVAPDAGILRVLGAPPGECPVGYVFQDYRATLLPWYTVLDNIRVSNWLNRKNEPVSREAIQQLIEDMGLEGLPIDAYPYQLSGGQQQIVCLLRAFVHSPALLLLDEPTSALDTRMSSEVWDVLHLLRERAAPSVLVVTHDLDESLIVSDRIICLAGTPCRIALDVENRTPRPRSLACLASPEANAVRRQILEVWSSV